MSKTCVGCAGMPKGCSHLFNWGKKGQTKGFVSVEGLGDEANDEYRHLSGGRQSGCFADVPDLKPETDQEFFGRVFGDDLFLPSMLEGINVSILDHALLFNEPVPVALATTLEKAKEVAKQGIMPVYLSGIGGAAICDPLNLL